MKNKTAVEDNESLKVLQLAIEQNYSPTEWRYYNDTTSCTYQTVSFHRRSQGGDKGSIINNAGKSQVSCDYSVILLTSKIFLSFSFQNNVQGGASFSF